VLEDQELWVALEYMPGGNLTKRLGMGVLCVLCPVLNNKSGPSVVRLEESEVARVLCAVCNALLLIHSKNRIHRDIKVRGAE
jgi:serine/threonine protein kinase